MMQMTAGQDQPEWGSNDMIAIKLISSTISMNH
ncbi:MAG: hypothetical protein K0S45_500 [Nitrospira sp.]|jgi:hypothetical protein|nr:hypothetical protein [Nitrospira sp.]